MSFKKKKIEMWLIQSLNILNPIRKMRSKYFSNFGALKLVTSHKFYFRKKCMISLETLQTSWGKLGKIVFEIKYMNKFPICVVSFGQPLACEHMFKP